MGQRIARELAQGPEVIAQSGDHRRRALGPATILLDAQTEMRSAEVVVGRREPAHGHVLLDLLREGVDLAGLAAVALPGRGVVAFQEGRVGMGRDARPLEGFFELSARACKALDLDVDHAPLLSGLMDQGIGQAAGKPELSLSGEPPTFLDAQRFEEGPGVSRVLVAREQFQDRYVSATGEVGPEEVGVILGAQTDDQRDQQLAFRGEDHMVPLAALAPVLAAALSTPLVFFSPRTPTSRRLAPRVLSALAPSRRARPCRARHRAGSAASPCSASSRSASQSCVSRRLPPSVARCSRPGLPTTSCSTAVSPCARKTPSGKCGTAAVEWSAFCPSSGAGRYCPVPFSRSRRTARSGNKMPRAAMASLPLLLLSARPASARGCGILPNFMYGSCGTKEPSRQSLRNQLTRS